MTWIHFQYGKKYVNNFPLTSRNKNDPLSTKCFLFSIVCKKMYNTESYNSNNKKYFVIKIFKKIYNESNEHFL